MYGLLVFDPLPDWEQEIKLQFTIQINDQTDFHFVVFRRTEQGIRAEEIHRIPSQPQPPPVVKERSVNDQGE